MARPKNLPLDKLIGEIRVTTDIILSKYNKINRWATYFYLQTTITSNISIQTLLLLSQIPKLTHWGRVTHTCVGKLTIIHSDYGLTPSRQCWSIVNRTPSKQLQWRFNCKWNIFIQENSLENIVWKMSAILSRPQCVKNISNLLLYSAAVGYSKPNFTSHTYMHVFMYNFHTGYIHFHAPGLSELTETTMIARSFIRRQWANNHLLGL